MHAALAPYWITIEHARGRTADHRLEARGRTADHRIEARGHWAAWWLGCQLWGRQNVVMVREVR